jgi:hypothetical protein
LDQQNRFVKKGQRTGTLSSPDSVCDVSLLIFFINNSGGELTGDTDGDIAAIMRDNDIITTTPEKWDSVTRRLKDHARLADMIRLLLVYLV